MNDLVKDFFTYDYKGKNYFGIVEVIAGEDLAQKRNTKKYETHIEKALAYTMQYKIVSHMSIQTYSTWLKDRTFREEKEDKYYPFVLEFEAEGRKYNDAVYEAAIYVQYLISEFNVNKKDILIMLNNSRSIYVYVNPKAYNLKPSPNLNKIYYEMYKHIKSDLELKYVDESVVASTYKVMKTPNCYYKGGYFVPISIKELMQLLSGAKTRGELTRYRKDLSKIKVPGELSLNFYKLYSKAINDIKKQNKKVDKQQYLSKCCGKCVSYFLKHLIEKGYRNYALVSIGIYLKNLGYTKQEVIRELSSVAEGWNHDETVRNITSKVNTIFRRNYKFSCKYVRSMCSDLGIESMCSSCPYASNAAKKKDMLYIDAKVIDDFWQKKASTRHYNAYLQILKNDLLNKKFSIDAYKDINYRTLREISKYTNSIIVKRNRDSNISIKYIKSSNIYMLPVSFLKTTAAKLGDYIKHYLKLLTKGYKALKNKILIHISMKRLTAELNYKDASGVSKFLKKLEQLGLLKVQKNSILSLYYKNYKVINLKEGKISKESGKTAVKQVNIFEEIMHPGIKKHLEKDDSEKINSG